MLLFSDFSMAWCHLFIFLIFHCVLLLFVNVCHFCYSKFHLSIFSILSCKFFVSSCQVLLLVYQWPQNKKSYLLFCQFWDFTLNYEKKDDSTFSVYLSFPIRPCYSKIKLFFNFFFVSWKKYFFQIGFVCISLYFSWFFYYYNNSKLFCPCSEYLI